MKQEQFTLTKEEFIKRSMAGEVFIRNGGKYHYDKNHINPFRFDSVALSICWKDFNDNKLFTLKQPEPIIERRWKWLIDLNEKTISTTNYWAKREDFESTFEKWYKHPTDFIDVEIQQGTNNETFS